MLNRCKLNIGNPKLIDPMPYHDMMKLVRESILVLTDSGGLQKEAFWSKVPCITLRDRTEWVETVSLGVNFIGGTKRNSISSTIKLVINNLDEIKSRFIIENPYGDSNASKKIINFLIQHL